MNVARIFVERLADQLRQESLPAADPAQVRRLGRRGTGRLFAVVPVQLSDQFFRFDRFDLHCKARQHLDLLFCRLVIPLPLAGTHHGVSLPVIRHEQVTPSLGGGEQLDDFGRDAFGKIHLIRRYSVQTIKARLKNVTSGIVAEYRTVIRTPIQYANPPMHPPNSSNRYCGNGANGVSSNANTRSPEPTYCRKRFPGRRQRSFRYIHTPPKTQPSSNVFVSMLYSIVPADDKNTDGSGTHKPNATSQFIGIVRWRRSATASTVAGTTGSRYRICGHVIRDAGKIRFDRGPGSLPAAVVSDYKKRLMQDCSPGQSLTVSRRFLSWSISQTLYSPSPSKSTTAVAVARKPFSLASMISMR